jgi:DNA polymerase-1
MAMIAISKRLPEFNDPRLQLTMQIHDELCFNVPEAIIEQVKTMVVAEMQNVMLLSVPLIAEAGYGRNWLDAH